MAEYLCGTCKTEVADNDNSTLCDLCDNWHHTICVDVSNANYEKLKVDSNHWPCPTCAEEIPFFALTNKDINNLILVFPNYQSSKKVDQKQKLI